MTHEARLPRSSIRGARVLDAALGHSVEACTAALVLAEVVVLFAGVVSRYALDAPLLWTDELASLLFLWLAMLGAVVAFRRAEHSTPTARAAETVLAGFVAA